MNRKHVLIQALSVMLLVLTSSCATTFRQNSTCQWIHSTLYFGLSSTQGEITEKQWQAFVNQHVTPRFRSGFTVYDAHGQWMMKTGKIIKEKTKVLVILHEDTKVADASIEEIRRTYKQLFNQDCVLFEKHPVSVSF